MYFVGTRIFMSARSSVRWAAALAATLAAWPAGADPVPVCTANGCYAMISTPGNFTAQLKACRSLYGGTQGAWSLAYFTRQQEYDDVADDCAGAGPAGSTYYVGLFDGIGAPMGSMATNIRQPNLTDTTYTGWAFASGAPSAWMLAPSSQEPMWAAGQPDNSGRDDNCVQMDGVAGGLRDVDCSDDKPACCMAPSTSPTPSASRSASRSASPSASPSPSRSASAAPAAPDSASAAAPVLTPAQQMGLGLGIGLGLAAVAACACCCFFCAAIARRRKSKKKKEEEEKPAAPPAPSGGVATALPPASVAPAPAPAPPAAPASPALSV